MICDTNFLSELYNEQQAGMQGPAAALLARHRQTPFLVTDISLGEVAVIFAVATRGRLHARLGGLKAGEIEGKDGLR